MKLDRKWSQSVIDLVCVILQYLNMIQVRDRVSFSARCGLATYRIMDVAKIPTSIATGCR